MAPHVEANSLSDITQLASNPPKYPRNPTEPRKASLTLYIARVPGSKGCYFLDIILTTLKPQLKNVTAADVASSLYYCHLNTEDDVRFLEQDQPVEEQKTAASREKPLPRKPLPESARSSLDLNHQMTSVSLSPQGNQEVSKKNPTASSRLFEETASIRNRATTDEAFSITLIRRDPSSGTQWNVGNVSGHPAPNETNHGGVSPKKKSKKSYFDISVHISTPGYGAFRVPVSTGHAANSTTDPAISSLDKSHMGHPQSPVSPNWSFDRQVRMEGSSFWSRPSNQHRTRSDLSGKYTTTHRRSSSGSSGGDPTDTSLHSYNSGLDPADSNPKGYMFVSPWGGRCKFATGSGGRSLTLKHTLLAPVSTSNTTDVTSSQQISAHVSELRFNLPSTVLFSSSTIKSASKRSSFDSRTLTTSKFSNLRKKLSPNKPQPPLPTRPHPTSYAAMYPSDEEEGPPLPPRSFHVTDSSEEGASPPLPTRLHHFPYEMNATHEEEIDDDPHLDLSIGQEKAGGGNRGKRAKLGKLVIHHEGFKMLDLVVAANIGVWWSVWESGSH
ncbi:hypothetical protein BGZ57DRAFT_751956 [Hyaloscypha finlandica]|nr:hypothetical protein BGZ57DRAFT_751956 [Hyaloscypha finlandica]